jgi:hypothetical protein
MESKAGSKFSFYRASLLEIPDALYAIHQLALELREEAPSGSIQGRAALQ